MKVEYYIAGKEHGDCTTPWGIRILEGGTVGEFIDMVLKNEKEWGYIGIWDKTIPPLLVGFGNPYMEYRYGKSLNRENLKDFENKQVIAASAEGGYSWMAYMLEVSDE